MVEVNLFKYRMIFYPIIFIGIFIAGWAGAMVSDRELPTLVYSAAPANPITKAGGELRMEYSIKRVRSCGVQVDRFIYDSQRSRFELPDTNVRPGLPLGDDHFFTSTPVPAEAASGPATLLTISTYFCNPLQYLFPIRGDPAKVQFIIQ